MNKDRRPAREAATEPPPDPAGTGPVTTRRTVLLGAGALGVTAVAAACGDGAGGPSGGANGPNPTRASGPLGSTSEVPVGGGKIFSAQTVVVTQPAADDFKGFSSICTHQGCPVTSVEGGTINCPCHGSRFSIEDGSVRSGPARRPLPPVEISVADGTISLP